MSLKHMRFAIMKDTYITCSLKNNDIDAPDGEYFISTSMLNYKLKLKGLSVKQKMKIYKSKTKVIVKGGLLELESLLKATSEIIDDCGYWGRFLECVWYNPKNKTLTIFVGS